MRKDQYTQLLKEFEAFFSTAVEEGEDNPDECTSSQYIMHEDGERYYLTKHLYQFHDVNCSVDKKNRQFGLRTDDDFWGVGYLPWRFRFLRIEDIVRIVWPHDKLRLIPTSPSHAFNEYYRKQQAIRYYKYYIDAGSVEGFKKKMGDETKSDREFALDIYRTSDESRRHLLKMLPKKDPLRKVLLKAKQKALKRNIIRRQLEMRRRSMPPTDRT